MNHYLAQFLTIAGLHLLAVMSPGPDFVMITRNALIYGRKTAILSAIGLGVGIATHVTYSLIGLGYLIAQSIVLFSVIKLLGAAYLIYIGLISFKSSPKNSEQMIFEKQENLSAFTALKMGFLTNALNPKVTLFFLSLFTLVVEKSTPLQWKFLYGVEMSVATFVWFALVSIIFSHTSVRDRIGRVQKVVEKVVGIALIGLGIKLAISKR